MKKTIIVVSILIIGNAVFWLWGPGIIDYIQVHLIVFEKSTVQAVYLTDGSIYIGHISKISSGEILLSNTYNIRLTDTSDQGTGQSETMTLQSGSVKNLALVKWGFYQPLLSSGSIHITKSMILYWETLSSGSEIVRQLKLAK